MSNKKCTLCKCEKSLTDFVLEKRHSDGRSSKCKECIRIYQKEYRKSERGKEVRKFHRIQEMDNNPELRRERSIRAYYKNRDNFFKHAEKRRNSIKGKASREVHLAIKLGLITKPTICNKCLAALPPARIHAHHHDYSKPLEIEWMCSVCHGKEHRGANYRNSAS